MAAHCPVRLSKVLLFTFILALVAGAEAQEKKRLSFDQIFKGAEPRITMPLPTIQGWADDERYIEMRRKEGDRKGGVFSVDARTGREEIYRDLEQYREVVGAGIEPGSPVANNEMYTRLIYAKEKDLYYLNAETKEFRRLTETPSEEKNPTISPDGKYVAFTRENNLFAIELATGKEYQYTTDGSDVVYNGWASWVYYEEILGRASRYRAFWWAPTSTHIAFYRFDDSKVPVFPLFNSEGQHGILENTRYPKAGDPNPEVKIGLVPVNGGPVVWAVFNEKDDQYFGMPFWTPDGKSLWVQWMNRGQDTLRICAVNPQTGKKSLVYEEYQKSWVEWLPSMKFLQKEKGFIIRTDKDGWMHLYLHDMSGRLRNRLTEGRWSVVDLLAVDEETGTVYFSAKKEASTRTDLYNVKLDGSGLTRMTFGEYTHTVRVSPTGKHFVTSYSNIVTPTRAAIYAGDGKLVREIGDSKGKEFDNYQLAKTELFRVPTPDGYNLPVIWTLPIDFDQRKKYPVLISIYGGPNSGTVSDGWNGISGQWLSMEGVIQVSVDHRGSGHFGKEGSALMHRNLGKWEINDYGEAVKWLRTKPFVDSTRICITGGSYGGYTTVMALTAGADLFTHGLALFSVSDWSLYDTHYVERYMDTPAENPDGYKNGSALTYANKYKGVLRMVHGAMDDNVHMQNSMQLVGKLQDLGKHFELMIYPGERHGWGGQKATHLRDETYRFYYQYLLGKEFPARLFEGVGMMTGRRRRE